MVLFDMQHRNDSSGMQWFLFEQNPSGQLPIIKITCSTASNQKVSIGRNTQSGHSLSQTNFDFRLLRIPVPDANKSFIILLGNQLLRVGVIGDVRHDSNLISIFVQDGCSFGIEHKELFVLTGRDDEGLFRGEDHFSTLLKL